MGRAVCEPVAGAGGRRQGFAHTHSSLLGWSPALLRATADLSVRREWLRSCIEPREGLDACRMRQGVMSGKDVLQREEAAEGHGPGEIWDSGTSGRPRAQSPGARWQMVGAEEAEGQRGRREPAVSEQGGGAMRLLDQGSRRFSEPGAGPVWVWLPGSMSLGLIAGTCPGSLA